MDLAQAFFLLQSLKQNIPSYSEVEKKWVDEYHSILDTVETESGADLSAFRVQEADFHRQVISARRASLHGHTPGQVQRSDKIVVAHSRLFHKLEAVLGYFRYRQSAGNPPKESIGFKAGAS